MKSGPDSTFGAEAGAAQEPWAKEQRIPVLLADESPVAEFILAMLRGRPVAFVYWGGSAPGEIRRVLVTEVFRVFEGGPVYAEGRCLKWKAERVFRLDRADLKWRNQFVEKYESG